MSEKFPFEKIPEEPMEEVEKEEELTPEEIREKLEDPFYLPTREEIFKAFYEEAWERWYEFCNKEDDPVFEFWNKEYIDAFSEYLIQRAKEFQSTKEKPLQILEVGAGNGKLTHFLKEQFEKKKIENIVIRATDSGEWMKPREGISQIITPHFPVEILDYKEALEKYKPDVVICSWMPYEEDWTADFRATDSLKEYILIGEKDGGCCGHPWETWGANPSYISRGEKPELYRKNKQLMKIREKWIDLDFKEWRIIRKLHEEGKREMNEEEREVLHKIIIKKSRLEEKLAKEREKQGIPYKKDGFERYDLNELKKYQICRTDDASKGRFYHSSTVSFRRKSSNVK
jgi:hypothetical protein